MFVSGHPSDLTSRNTALIISNEEMNGIMKIVTSLKKSGLLKRGVSETIKNESKEQKRGFLRTLLGTLGASLLGNLLAGKGTIRAGKDAIRAAFFMPSHPVANFEIQNYYQNEPKINGVYSRNNLPKIKDETYVINLDGFKLIGTH